jgi:hypothetical protein
MSRTFRLALAPGIVKPTVNRLLLIPACDMGVDSIQAEFREIRDQMRELYGRLGVNKIMVLSYTWKTAAEHGKGFEMVGCAHLALEESEGPVDIHFAHDRNRPFQRELQVIFNRAGSAIPNRVRSQLHSASPTSAYAAWMAVLHKFSEIRPDLMFYFQKIADTPPEKRFVVFEETGMAGHPIGLIWGDPIGASLSAMEAAGLLDGDASAITPLAGEWSVPMSKSEFARRILQKGDARARDVRPIWHNFEKQQGGKNTWTFRLDTLPPETRKKLEGGKP